MDSPFPMGEETEQKLEKEREEAEQKLKTQLTEVRGSDYWELGRSVSLHFALTGIPMFREYRIGGLHGLGYRDGVLTVNPQWISTNDSFNSYSWSAVVDKMIHLVKQSQRVSEMVDGVLDKFEGKVGFKIAPEVRQDIVRWCEKAAERRLLVKAYPAPKGKEFVIAAPAAQVPATAAEGGIMRTRRGCSTCGCGKTTADSLIGPMSAEEVDAEAGPKEGPPAMAQPLRARRDYGASERLVEAGVNDRYEKAFEDAMGMMEKDQDGEPARVLRQVGHDNGIAYGPDMKRFVTWAMRKMDYGALRAASARKASDAMGFLARQMAEEWVDQNWTTAERGWREQAKKGMKVVESKWDGGKEEQGFVFETKVVVPQEHYVDDAIRTRITVRVSEQTL